MTKIHELLSSLTESLKRYEQSQLTIDKDLSISLTRDLYAALLNRKNEEQKIETAADEIITAEEEIAVEEPKIEVEITQPEVVKVTHITPPPPPVFEAPKPATEEPKPVIQKPRANFSINLSEPETDADSKSVNDNFANRKPELADKMEQKPIADLKEAMTMNERFSFINNLFNEDGKKFNDAVEELNQLQTYEQAYDLVKSKFASDDWNKATDVAFNFMKIVKRRFS